MKPWTRLYQTKKRWLRRWGGERNNFVRKITSKKVVFHILDLFHIFILSQVVVMTEIFCPNVIKKIGFEKGNSQKSSRKVLAFWLLTQSHIREENFSIPSNAKLGEFMKCHVRSLYSELWFLIENEGAIHQHYLTKLLVFLMLNDCIHIWLDEYVLFPLLHF